MPIFYFLWSVQVDSDLKIKQHCLPCVYVIFGTPIVDLKTSMITDHYHVVRRITCSARPSPGCSRASTATYSTPPKPRRAHCRCLSLSRCAMPWIGNVVTSRALGCTPVCMRLIQALRFSVRLSCFPPSLPGELYAVTCCSGKARDTNLREPMYDLSGWYMSIVLDALRVLEQWPSQRGTWVHVPPS